jgi:ubiquinol-cytochrome c reductase cytochrome b subunit
VIGPDLSLFIRGDYVVSDATLNRFFSFHVIAVPLVLLGLVVAHIIALHEVGSNNPDGVEIKAKKDENGIPLDGIPFHPYYTVHDIWAWRLPDHLLGRDLLLPRSGRLLPGATTSSRPIR